MSVMSAVLVASVYTYACVLAVALPLAAHARPLEQQLPGGATATARHSHQADTRDVLGDEWLPRGRMLHDAVPGVAPALELSARPAAYAMQCMRMTHARGATVLVLCQWREPPGAV